MTPLRDFDAARALVLEHGSSANAYQILNPGILHWFASRGDAVVGHARYGRFLVVAGAPVSSDDRLAAVLGEFEKAAHAGGLRVCYFGVESPVASHFRERTSHSMIRLGAQPVWTPAAWARGVEGHPSLRAQFRRARNKGVVVRELPVFERPAGEDVRLCLDQWLRTRRSPTMHFLVEPDTLGHLRDRRLFVAERDSRVAGFLLASPVPRRRGWLVEQIVRGDSAVNGTSELLVNVAMRSLAEGGSEYVTLGLAPLSTHSTVGEVPTALWLRLLLRWVRAHGRRFYNFEGLDAFKAKLRPDGWEPLYAITDRGRFSPEVLLAIGGAFTRGRPFATTARALAWAVAEEAGSITGVRLRHREAPERNTQRR